MYTSMYIIVYMYECRGLNMNRWSKDLIYLISMAWSELTRQLPKLSKKWALSNYNESS